MARQATSVEGDTQGDAALPRRRTDRWIDDVRFLADSGWFATEQRYGTAARVWRFSPSGEERWSVEIPRSAVLLDPEDEPGRLWVGAWEWGGQVGTSHLLDLESGRFLQLKHFQLDELAQLLWRPAVQQALRPHRRHDGPGN